MATSALPDLLAMTNTCDFLLHHARDARMLPTLQKLWSVLQQLQYQNNGQCFVELALKYGIWRSHGSEKCDILKQIGEKLDPDIREDVMRLWQAVKQEGIHQGVQQGFEQTALGMLRKGIALKDIMEITHLSKQKLLKLRDKLK